MPPNPFAWIIVFFIALSLKTSLAQAAHQNPQVPRNQVSRANDWVYRDGTRLVSGGKNFNFVGANQYYLFYKSKEMVDEVLQDAARMGITVIRTWAFCDGEWSQGQSLQPNPGEYREESFQRLDYIIKRASELGIKIVFSLVNNWDAYGGMNAYVRWSGSAHTHDDFYSDWETRRLFRNYINYVLWRTNSLTGVRYKDDPTILMWELANEPRADSWRQQDLFNWIHEMAGFIKSIDSQHLVSTGSEGDIASDFVKTHESPYIDVGSFHLYPEHWNFSEEDARWYIGRHVQTGRNRLGKPVYAGEFGRTDKGQRDRVYQSWFDEFLSQNIAGAMVWVLAGHQENGTLYPDYDGYTIYYPESGYTISLFENFARQMQSRSAERRSEP